MGVAIPRAQGHATTSTDSAARPPRARSPPTRPHARALARAINATTGTKRATKRSAAISTGARRLRASRVQRSTRLARVSDSPTASSTSTPSIGDRSREDGVAGTDQSGHRLAGERRLGNVRGPLDHAAVDRDFFAGAHAHPLPAHNLVRRNISLARLLEHAGSRTRALDGGSKGRRRSLSGARVQILPEHDEDEHHRSGVVVEVTSPANGLDGRSRDRRERSHGDQRFEDDMTASGRPIGRPEHGNAEQKINSRSQGEHQPGGRPEHVDCQVRRGIRSTEGSETS